MADYKNIEINTVRADNQLRDCGHIRFFHTEGRGKRIMLVGNSMTLHGPNADIGWCFDHGMAASAPEKDYAHRLMASVLEIAADASFCICQASTWEMSYKRGGQMLSDFEAARRFAPDIIVMRIVENCPMADFEPQLFKDELDKLLRYLDMKGTAELILTTGFWRHPADSAIEEYAGERGLAAIRLGDLGDDDSMKAVGLFEHKGVANHPNDRGMQAMADRILDELKKLL